MKYQGTLSSCLVLSRVQCLQTILGQVFWAAQREENLTWSRWPTGSSASATLHGILGPCSSCVPIRKPWLMWPVLAFHLAPPAPHLVHGAWWTTTNCHWLALRGWVCPHIPLIDSWSSHCAQVSPRHISLDLTHNMVWNINPPSQGFPSIGGVKKEQHHGKLKRCERELGFRLYHSKLLSLPTRRVLIAKLCSQYTVKTKEMSKILF